LRPNVQVAGAAGPKVSSHLVPAILCTLFCCLPFGIVAIIYAAQVNGKAASGDYAGAQDYAHKAAIWCWVSFGIGLAGSLVYLAIMIIGAIASSSGNY
jgi:hypothetical protein